MPEIHYVGKNGGRYIGRETLCGLSSRSRLPRKRLPRNDSYTTEAKKVTCEACMDKLVAGGGYEKLKYTDNCIPPKVRFIGSGS
jgi:hypothetical protein